MWKKGESEIGIGVYFGGLNWSSEGGEDEVKKLFSQLRVRVTEKADARGSVDASDADNGRIQP